MAVNQQWFQQRVESVHYWQQMVVVSDPWCNSHAPQYIISIEACPYVDIWVDTCIGLIQYPIVQIISLWKLKYGRSISQYKSVTSLYGVVGSHGLCNWIHDVPISNHLINYQVTPVWGDFMISFHFCHVCRRIHHRVCHHNDFRSSRQSCSS